MGRPPGAPGVRFRRPGRLPRRDRARRPVRLSGPRRPGDAGGRPEGPGPPRRRPLRLELPGPAGRAPGTGRAAEGAGIFSNVSGFRRTADEIAYDRRAPTALGGPPGLGAVVGTGRNGAGPPADGAWCDPDGRSIGRAPTLDTGEPRVDACLRVKPPGEFSPSYAGEPAAP